MPEITIRRRTFVVGYMHSGTTLLQNVLGKHPMVFSPRGETKFFELEHMIAKRFPDLEDDETKRAFIAFLIDAISDGFSVRTPPREGHSCRDPGILQALTSSTAAIYERGAILAAVFDALAAAAGKEAWLEKTPTHIFSIERILQSVPSARFVEIIRDPRDVLASKRTRRETVWRDRYRPEIRHVKHLEKAYDPFWDALAWKSALRAGGDARARHPGHVLRVRYEDLVNDPPGEIAKVLAFIDLPFQPDILEVDVANPADDALTGQRVGVSARSVGRWREVLEPGEVLVCQLLARTEMLATGYTLVPTGTKSIPSAVSLTFSSVGELFVRLFRKWRLGGSSYIVNVMRNYLARTRSLFRKQ